MKYRKKTKTKVGNEIYYKKKKVTLEQKMTKKKKKEKEKKKRKQKPVNVEQRHCCTRVPLSIFVLFSFLSNLERKHFGGSGVKTPESYYIFSLAPFQPNTF